MIANELIQELLQFTQTIECRAEQADDAQREGLKGEARELVHRTVEMLTGFNPAIHLTMPPRVIAWLLCSLRMDVYQAFVDSNLEVVLEMDGSLVRLTLYNTENGVQIGANLIIADEDLVEALLNEPFQCSSVH